MRLLADRRRWERDVAAAARRRTQDELRGFGTWHLRIKMDELAAPLREIAGRASMISPGMALARYREQVAAFQRAAELNLAEWDRSHAAAAEDAGRLWEAWRAENRRLRSTIEAAGRALHDQFGQPGGHDPCRCPGCELIRDMDAVPVTAESGGLPANAAGPPDPAQATWCACGESFASSGELEAHLLGRQRARPAHYRSVAAPEDAPVVPGGLVRALLETTDDRRITADLVVDKVTRERCGCWSARADRPGPDIGPLTGRRVEVFFPREECGLAHDGWDRTGPRPEPPVVVRRGPAPPARAESGEPRARTPADSRTEPGPATLRPGPETRQRETSGSGPSPGAGDRDLVHPARQGAGERPAGRVVFRRPGTDCPELEA